jgi:hypothetical protein
MTLEREDLANGIEHVLHEMRLLVGSLSLSRQRRMRLSLPPDALSPDLLSLAVRATPIELPALHASHLLTFFAASPPGDEFLRATHYLDGFQVDDPLRSRLEVLRERVEVQVAPLTKQRISNEGDTTGPHSFSFRPGEFLPLLECCRRFAHELCQSSWLDAAPPTLQNDWRETGSALETLIGDIG